MKRVVVSIATGRARERELTEEEELEQLEKWTAADAERAEQEQTRADLAAFLDLRERLVDKLAAAEAPRALDVVEFKRLRGVVKGTS